MARTVSFRELVQSEVARDAAFADALLREGIETLLKGDVETGKTILRDYIKATVGFEKLGAAWYVRQETDAHVPPQRQSSGQESVYGDWAAAKAGGPEASRGERAAACALADKLAPAHERSSVTAL